MQDGDFSVDQFVEVVRQHAGGHTDGDTVAAEHQQAGEFGGQNDRFFLASVVVRNKRRDVVVEHRFIGEFGQSAFGVTACGSGTSGQDITEVPLFHNEVRNIEELRFFHAGLTVAVGVFDHAALVGKHHQSITDGGVSVGMIVHGIADDIGNFLRSAVVNLIQRPEDAPLNGFQTVINVGNGPRTDHITSIIQKVPVDHLAEIVVRAAFFLCDSGGIHFFFDLGSFDFVTHNPRPQDCS